MVPNRKRRVRINQFISRAGVASRRGADQLVRDGRVSVNGERLTQPGLTIDPDSDLVEVDGKPITVAEKHHVFRYYKPRGVISSLADERGRWDLSAIATEMPAGCVPVGRLDRDSEGLVLWTNNGAWVNYLTHPRYGARKQYRVTISGLFEEGEQEQFEQLSALPDGETLSHRARVLGVKHRTSRTVVDVQLQEGKNQQLRRMFEALGCDVHRLVRTGEAGVLLGKLRPGQVQPLQGRPLELFLSEIKNLQSDRSRRR